MIVDNIQVMFWYCGFVALIVNNITSDLDFFFK